MSNLSENVREAYEEYLIGNKKQALSMLIPGTEHHYYLSIIDALKRERHKVSKETIEMIKTFKNLYKNQDSTRVYLQELFLKYDGAKTDKERNSVIDKLNSDFIHANFNHSKPADVKRKKGKKGRGAKKDASEFDLSKHYNEEEYLKKVYKNSSTINSLHKMFYNKVDFNQISDKDFMKFLPVVDTFASMSNQSFWEKLVTTFDQNYQKNKNYHPDSYLYDKFTLQQLEDLGEKLEKVKEDMHFVGKIFEKKFHFELDSENEETFTLQERREQLIAMHEASKNRPQSLKSALLLEILENGVKLDIFDKNYFLEYLKNPLKTWHMSKKQKKKGDIHNNVWNQYLGRMKNRQGGIMDSKMDKKLYKRYLEQFYNDSGNLDDFKKYFDQDFLVELLEEFEFLAGNEIKKEKIDAKRFERLTNLVSIDLLECNKDVFKKNDRVKLVLDIKNCPTLHVKIFEFNSENYYRKNLAPFRTDVNLDGLVTAFEEKHEYKELPQKKFRQVFEFPQLDDRVGLFIIEFISNGYSSRAVIKKGSLSLIYKSTVAGQVAYILDENKEICK